jgi:hypothetical protein
MNIFAIDEHPVRAARQMVDKHVVKMILEAGQMLSTSHRVLDGEEYYDRTKNNRRIKRWRLSDEREGKLWKASFVGHPCTQWTMESRMNYRWHATHALALCREYTHRYEKVHNSQGLIEYLFNREPLNIKEGGLTKFAVAMPDQYKVECSVESYRNYYRGEKAYFAKWKNRDTPIWWE